MFSIIGRYLLRETLVNWLGVTGVLLLILLSSRFARFLGEAAAGKLPGEAVFSLLGLAMINYLTVLIPVGLLFAIMLALGRLYRDSEMTALMACGGGPARLYRALAWLSGAIMVLLAVLSLQVSPWAARQSAEVRQAAEHEASRNFFEAGRFKGTQDGRRVFYAEAVHSDGRLEDVFMHAYADSGTVVVRAARGAQREADDGRRELLLRNGYRYQGVPGEAAYDVVRFAEHGISMEPEAAGSVRLKRELLPTERLLASRDPRDRAELQWRLSVPLMAAVLTLLAVPLARTRPREGRYGRLLAAILVYVLYSNLLGVAKVWVERARVPTELGLWWVHALFILAALVLLARQNNWPAARLPRRQSA